MKRKSKSIIIILPIACITAVFLVLLNPELKYSILYEIHPSHARLSNFVKCSKDKQALYILGTAHKQLKDNGRSLLYIESAIENLRPNVVLVESRPEQIAKGNWADGPIEMLYAHLTAKSLGIPADGFDWHENEPSKFGKTWKQRDDHMVRRILERVPGHPVVLVITGYSHVREFISRLKQAGYSLDLFPRDERGKLLDISGKKLLFPRGMIHYVRKAIERAEMNLTKLIDKKAKSINENYINIMKRCLRIIERTGEK